MEPSFVAGLASDPTDDVIDVLDLNRAIAQLDPDDRLIVDLFYFLDLPEKILAEMLAPDLQPDKARNRVNTDRRRAERRLSRMMVVAG